MDLCNCNNNTDSSRLRMVRGNDFSTLYTINAKYADDTPVPNWDITQCTDISIKVHRVSSCKGVDSTKDISAYGSYRFANTNVLIIDWDGLLMKVGTYTVDFAAKFDGVDIRWYSKLTKAFDIVESNEEANIPEDAFIDDGIYRLDGDFVLMFGVQQQADWDEEDPTHPAYIKNRPEGIDTRDLLRKDEAALIYLAKADAHIPEHGSLDTSTKEMNFYDENDVLLFSIDATAALKDASISDITYSNGYLTFQFNADAERPTIQFYIGDAFDSDSYYNKIASDLRYVTSTTLLDYYTAQEINSLLGAINTSINTINGKIPSAASSSNQLADKDFVNSSISTATATFRGTSATGLTESQFITWANSLTHDLNDYVYWNTTDTAGNTVYKRYKYNGTAWVYEYDLNNSSFTSSEWAAIQSGITTSLVTKLSDLPTNASLTNSLSNKQDTIGDLSDIRSGAQAGSTAYQLPNGGVPSTDMSSAVQASLGKADGAIQMPTGGTTGQVLTKTSNGVAWDDASGGVVTETDPIFVASPAYGITSTDIAKWDAAAVVADDDGSATTPDFDAEADTVWHKAQTLSAAQKTQARTNIGAQEELVSGTNIKTINNTSLLGSGNISIGGDANVQSDWNESDSSSDAYIKNKPTVPAAGIPSGGNAGQVLTKTDGSTDYAVAWRDTNNIFPSAYCTTAAATAAKNASCTFWTATANSYLHILITKANSNQGALTLNVNSTGAAPIYINGTASSATNYTLPAGSYIIFYDGTNYYFRTDGKLTASITGTASGGGGGGDTNVIESISINGTAQTVTSKNVDLPVPTSADVYYIVKKTQAQYDALATKDSTTLYIITS